MSTAHRWISGRNLRFLTADRDMLRRYDWRFFGWLAPLFIPMIIAAKYDGSWEPNMHQSETSEHDWIRVEWCRACGNETDHHWIQYRDEPVVTRECMDCEHVSTYWDSV